MLDLWFGPKPFEYSGALYERLGVRTFKKFVPFGDYTNRLVRSLLASNFKIVSNISSAMVWVLFTVLVEAFHTLVFIVFAAFMVSNLLDQEYAKAVANLAVNLMVNVYPIIVQRYNRIRLLRAFRLNLKNVSQWDI